MRGETTRIFLFLSLFFFAFVKQVFATPSAPAGAKLTLSEVFACQKTAPNDDEWVEVYNPTSSSVDLTGWKIGKNKAGSVSLSGSIESYAYKKVVFSPGLANDGFAVTLFESGADSTDVTKALESFPSGYAQNATTTTLESCPNTTLVTSWMKEGETWKITTTISPDAQNSYTALVTPTPSPTATPLATASPTPTASPTTAPTATPTPSPTPNATTVPQPTGIILSEIFACQSDSGKEWAELQNTNAYAVTLVDWKLQDDDGNEQPIARSEIGANGFFVVEIAKYVRGMFTNDGDVVKLVNGSGNVVDSYAYSACTKDMTWSRADKEWTETSNISKGGKNNTVSISPSPSQSASPSATLEALMLGDGGGEMGKGAVLGASAPSADQKNPSKLSSILLIVFGGVLLTGVGIYSAFGDKIWKK